MKSPQAPGAHLGLFMDSLSPELWRTLLPAATQSMLLLHVLRPKGRGPGLSWLLVFRQVWSKLRYHGPHKSQGLRELAFLPLNHNRQVCWAHPTCRSGDGHLSLSSAHSLPETYRASHSQPQPQQQWAESCPPASEFGPLGTLSR